MNNTLNEIVKVSEQLDELKSNLYGMDFKFGGNHAVLQYINSDMTVDLYIEYENGDTDFLNIGIHELIKATQ